MARSHYQLEQDGTLKVVTTTEREIVLDASILNRFGADVALKTDCLMSANVLPEGMALGNIGLCMHRTSMAFTVRLGLLPMRCAFIMKEGVMVPDLKHGNDDVEVVMNWQPPEDMRLYALFNFMIPRQVDTQFLIAVDEGGRHYRLPLSNMEEDGHLCHGTYDGNGSSFIDMLSKAWLQFHKSRWQSDLIEHGTDVKHHSQALFRFKPLEPAGFEQLPPLSPWQQLSNRISTAFIAENLIV